MMSLRLLLCTTSALAAVAAAGRPKNVLLATSKGALTSTRAYVQQALCAPMRNSLLSGRRPDTTKAWNFVYHFREKGVGADWQTLPQVFTESGLHYIVVGTPFSPVGAPDVTFHRPENDFLEPFTDVVACGGVQVMAPNATLPPKCVKA